MTRETLRRGVLNAVTPRGTFVGRAFHLQFKPFALAQCVSGVVPLLLFARNAPDHLLALAIGLLLFKIGFSVLFFSFIVARYFPVYVGESGVRARNFWGLAHNVAWDDITRVAPIQWLIFARFARLSTRRQGTIWLPLFLAEQHEFASQVRTLASKDNPLRQWFEL